MNNKFDFLYDDKHQVFYNLIPSCLLTIAKRAKSTQNNKFAISQERRAKLDFLLADKHQISLQVKTKFLGGWPVMPRLRKITTLQNLCNTSKKK